MSENEKIIAHVNLRVPEKLYLNYKIALLRRYPRRNVTQDLIAYMHSVVQEDENLNEIK